MNYRIDKKGLLEQIAGWDGFVRRRVRLIACGGTALTLSGVKESTKDIDLLVPDLKEYEYLLNVLGQLGYKSCSSWGWTRGDGFVFDLFPGKTVHTTELLESPLKKGNHVPVKEFSRIYLGMLNYYDLIIHKLFRATSVDIDDCLALIKVKGGEIDVKRLERRFRKTASFDVGEEKVNKNLAHFLGLIKKGRPNGEK